jgi:predicted nucleic acid-binding protein
MRAVLDTNVVISATLILGGNEDRILRAWQRGAFELILSPPIFEEMARALFYERLRKFRWMSEEEVLALLQSLTGGSLHVSGKVAVGGEPRSRG